MSVADLQALIDAGRYADAERQGMARVAALETARGASAPEIADTLDLVIEARYLGRRLTQPDTVALAERALRIKEAAYAPDDPRVATTLVLVGFARATHRRPDDAREAVQRAMTIRERVFGPESVEVAAVWNALAFLEWTKASFVSAAERAGRALDIARRAEQPPGRETETALTMIGFAARHQNDPEGGVRILGEALAIGERLHGPAHPALVYLLMELGAAYWDTGEHAHGLALRDRALQVLEATPGSDYRLAFELMLDSGLMGAAGEYVTSLNRAQRAVATAERATGPGSALTAGTLDQLAAAQARLGDHEAAAASRQKAMAIWTARGADSLHAGMGWAALADSYDEAGQIDKGLEAIGHAVSNAALAKEPVPFSQALQVKARLLLKGGRLDEARAVLEQARRASESAPTHTARTDMADVLRLFARVERQAGDPARAVPLFREALRQLEDTRGPTHATVANWRTEFAGLLAEAGELAEARRLLIDGEATSLDHLRLVARGLSDQAALAYAATRVSGIDLAVSLALANLANAGASRLGATASLRDRKLVSKDLATGDARRRGETAWPSGRRPVGKSLASGGRSRRGDTPWPSGRTLVIKDLASGGGSRRDETALPSGPKPVSQDKDPKSRDVSDITLAWDMLIRGRTVVLDEMAARQRAITQEAAHAVLRGRWTTLNHARARLASLIVRGPQERPSDQYDALVQRARAARDQAERELAEASVAFRQEQQRSRAGGRDVLTRLAPDAAIVSYVRYTPQPLARSARPAAGTAAYAAFIARAGRPVTIVPLGPADRIESAVGAWRDRIRGELVSAGLAPRRGEAAYRAAGDALRSLIWDPLQPHLPRAATIFIVPDGAIHLVDLSTLPVGRAGYLADAPIVLHYLLAERDLVDESPASTNERLLALGAPDFDNADRVTASPDVAANASTTATLPASSPTAAATAATRATASTTPTTTSTPPTATASTIPSRAATAATATASASTTAAPTAGLATLTASPARTTQRRGTSACEASLAARFDPLPSTRDEVQHIAQMWRQGLSAWRHESPAAATRANGAARGTAAAASDVELLGGARATEAAFKELASGRRVLHVATHGFFLDRHCNGPPPSAKPSADARPSDAPSADAQSADARSANARSVDARSTGAPAADPRSADARAVRAPSAIASSVNAPFAGASSSPRRALEESPLLRSGLILAGANQRAATGSDTDDGILTAEEIAGLDLSGAQWAVLSACDTGRGDWQAGEGVLGLRRAFQVAGARTVILSLWPVLDTVTASWMTELYRGKFVEGKTTAAAVRAANRALLAERRAKGESTHPLYWSGFIATGDWH